MQRVSELLRIFVSCGIFIFCEACVTTPDDALNKLQIKNFTSHFEVSKKSLENETRVREFALTIVLKWTVSEGVEFDGILYKLEIISSQGKISSSNYTTPQQVKRPFICDEVNDTIWATDENAASVQCVVPCEGIMPPTCAIGGVCQFLKDGYQSISKDANSIRVPMEFGQTFNVRLLANHGWKTVELGNFDIADDDVICREELIKNHEISDNAANLICRSDQEGGENGFISSPVSNFAISEAYRDMNINRGVVVFEWQNPHDFLQDAHLAHYEVHGEPTQEIVLPSEINEDGRYQLKMSNIEFDAYFAIHITPVADNKSCEGCALHGKASIKIFQFPDIDACSGDNFTFPYCDEKAICIDFPATSNTSGLCTCPTGYKGNGINITFINGTGCVDLDSCSDIADQEGICHPDAVCVDLPPPSLGVNCYCPESFIGDGYQSGYGCQKLSLLVGLSVGIPGLIIVGLLLGLYIRRKRKCRKRKKREKRRVIECDVFTVTGGHRNKESIMVAECSGDCSTSQSSNQITSPTSDRFMTGNMTIVGRMSLSKENYFEKSAGEYSTSQSADRITSHSSDRFKTGNVTKEHGLQRTYDVEKAINSVGSRPKTDMPSQHRSQSDQEYSVSLSSGESQAERAKKASAAGRKTQQRERYSSGYGSLDESTDSVQHTSRSSSTRSHKTATPRARSPPPNYFDEPQAPEYERIPSTDQAYYPDTIADRQTAWSSGSQRFCSTVVEVPEEVDIFHLRSSGQDGRRHPPDMILGNSHRLTRGSPLKVQVDGEKTEYELLPLVNDNGAIELLKRHTENNIFLRTDAVKKCEIHGSNVTAVFRYQLMTLAEEREMLEKTKPYTGETLGKSHKIQSVWDYEVDIPKHFRDCSESLVLSNTERLCPCKNCNKTGKVRCTPCDGLGSKTCERCHGHNREPMSPHPCLQCSGGFQTCSTCHGSGGARCDNCEGKCEVVAYKVVKVTWKAKKSMYMDACLEVERKRLLRRRGREVFSECGDRLNPISEKDLLHKTIRRCSRRELENHSGVNGKIVQQKHLVDLIPIQSFDCCYKGKTPFLFYVIGLEKKIFVPDFPKKRLSLVANLFSR